MTQVLTSLTKFASGGVCHLWKTSSLILQNAESTPNIGGYSNPAASDSDKPINRNNATVRKVITVKTLKPKWALHNSVRRQFSVESRILSCLEYSGLPIFMQSGVCQHGPYLAYEFYEGLTLLQLAQKNHLLGKIKNENQLLKIILQLIAQVYYCHQLKNPVIHGDISFDNILIDFQGDAHLLDFGSGHFSDSANQESYLWLAKPSYLSPEQAQGSAWGMASDWYQVGIVIYEILTGTRWNRAIEARQKRCFAANPPRLHQKNLNQKLSLLLQKYKNQKLYQELLSTFLLPKPKERLKEALLILPHLNP